MNTGEAEWWAIRLGDDDRIGQDDAVPQKQNRFNAANQEHAALHGGNSN